MTWFGLSVAAMPAAVERMYVHTMPARIISTEQMRRSTELTGSISP